jgi:SAM-dependent methyltransferase
MASRKENLNEKAWHGDQDYDPKEMIRLVKACAEITAEADGRGISAGYRVLDVGCGIGPLYRWLDTRRFHITGVDISAEAIDIVRQRYAEGQIVDIEKDWPFPADAFDAIHAGAVMEHVRDWHHPLNQANRVLKPGGLLVVSVPNLRYWKEVRRLLTGRQPHWMRDMLHLHAYTPTYLSSLLKAHGFDVASLQADRVNLPLLPDNAWVTRTFARWGSVLIAVARKSRSVRVEDQSLAHAFPGAKPVPSVRAIEIPE